MGGKKKKGGVWRNDLAIKESGMVVVGDWRIYTLRPWKCNAGVQREGLLAGGVSMTLLIIWRNDNGFLWKLEKDLIPYP